MNGEINTIVNYELAASEHSFWKRFSRIWLRYNLLISFLALFLLLKNGYSSVGLLMIISLELLLSLYSWIETKTILLKLTYNEHSDRVQVIILQYNKPRERLLALRKDVKVQVRKRYRYRYPIDCLLILYQNKEVYVQEERAPAWTTERFFEIEKCFKALK